MQMSDAAICEPRPPLQLTSRSLSKVSLLTISRLEPVAGVSERAGREPGGGGGQGGLEAPDPSTQPARHSTLATTTTAESPPEGAYTSASRPCGFDAQMIR